MTNPYEPPEDEPRNDQPRSTVTKSVSRVHILLVLLLLVGIWTFFLAWPISHLLFSGPDDALWERATGKIQTVGVWIAILAVSALVWYRPREES